MGVQPQQSPQQSPQHSQQHSLKPPVVVQQQQHNQRQSVLQQSYKSPGHAAFVQNQNNKNMFIQNGAPVAMGIVGGNSSTVKHK